MATCRGLDRDQVSASGDDDSHCCEASRMWRVACDTLDAPSAAAADVDLAWSQIVASSPPHSIWHSIKNCVAYQAGVWHSLLANGISDVMQPAAFKMAIVLRHTPSDLVVKILGEMLKSHPQCRDLTSYVLALLTDDEATGCADSDPPSPTGGPAPRRDLQLYGDCELAVLAASTDEYDAHARLVRAEYAQLSQTSYAELRIKILNQFSLIPKLFHTPEFEGMEVAARENIKREIQSLSDLKM